MYKPRILVNGFGTIGKRVADAISKQDDIELLGVAKTRPNIAASIANSKNYRLYVPEESIEEFEEKGFKVEGSIREALEKADLVVDATPKGVGAKYKPLYEKTVGKAIFQGGEKHSIVEVSFNTLANYEEALGKSYVRVVSCNTTGLARLISTLNMNFKVRRVRATIIRRAVDPQDVKGGPVNAILLNPPKLPSHHGEDLKTVIKGLDVVTAAVAVPTTLMHVHHVYAEVGREVSREEVLEALSSTPRILLVSAEDTGIDSTAQLIEWARDKGRERYDIPELVIWSDSITVKGREVSLFQAVHQEAIVVPENIDAIRAVFKLCEDKWKTIEKTDSRLGVERGWLR